MRTFSKTIILILGVLLISHSLFMVLRTFEAVDNYKKTMKITTGQAGGILSLCINSQPAINTSDCSANATQNAYYECWINASDPDYTNLTYFSLFAVISRAFSNSTQEFFTVTQSGLVNFTPTNDDVGNYTIQFTVNDGVGCANSEDSEYLSLTVINVNDPPYLVAHIPDQTINESETVHAFYLDNYFDDPDQDDLTYSVVSTSSVFNIYINNLTSDVVISSSQCGVTAYAVFSATDPYNETNTSNVVTLRCVEEEGEPGTEGTGAGEGGAGGSIGPCISEYECYDYFKCRRNNTKVQNCVDIHGCEKDIFLTVPCKYVEEVLCNESWNCSEWSPCLPKGTQDRICDDMNKCGTTLLKPPISQECTYVGTCSDSIKNCHDGSCEEGIDCGGPCPPCKSIEVPYPFEEEKGIFIYILTGIILLLLTAILLYHYFRKEINATLAKAGWIITQRKKKQILLSIEDKRKLLDGIKELEAKLGAKEMYEILNEYAELLRYYLVKVVSKGLVPEFDADELKTTLEQSKSKIREILRKIFISMFAHYQKIEGDKSLITKTNITLLLEELRNIVLQTSKVETDDITREVKELKPHEKASGLEKLAVNITNAYIALEYLELEIAKKKYLDMLAKYEQLKIKEQEDVFEDLSRLYHNISYVNSWLGKVKE
jgi:hypothetical protein